MAFTDQNMPTGRYAKWTTQVTDQDPEAQAMDPALREARNWVALRSFAVHQCPIKATAHLVVTASRISAQGTVEKRRSLFCLEALWRLVRK